MLLTALIHGIYAEEPLEASIDYPVSGQNVSGTLLIKGSAGGANFASYSLRLRQNSSYRHLTNSSQTAKQDLLHRLNTPQIGMGSYLLVLDVRDSNNNGKMDEVPIFIDNSAPDILSLAVEKGIVGQGVRTVNFNFSLTEEGSGIKDIEIKGESDSYQLERNSRSFTASLEMKDNRRLTLSVTDYAGNSDNKSVVIDAAPPKNLTLGPNYVTDSANQLKICYLEYNTKQVALKRNNKVIAQGENLNSTNEGQKQVCQYLKFDTSHLQAGSNQLTLQVDDVLGRRQSKQFEVTYDPYSPHLEINNLLPQQILSKDREVSIFASDNITAVDKIELEIDGDAWQSWTGDGEHRSQLKIEEIGEGLHRLEARAKDGAGNQARETIEFTVDLSAPSVTRVEARPNPTNSRTLLNVKASDHFSPLIKADYGLVKAGENRLLGSKELEGKKEQFEVVISQLRPGKNTLWTKVMDAEGHWSEIKTVNVSLDPSLTNNLQVIKQMPGSLRQGKGNEVELILKNKGEAELVNLRLETENPLVKDLVPDKADLEIGETISFTLDVELPVDYPLGSHNLSFTANSLSYTDQYNLAFKVLPGNSTKQKIENRSERLYSFINRLQQKVSDLNEINPDLAQAVQQEIQAARSKLEKASENISVGDYQTAHSLAKLVSRQAEFIKQNVSKLEELKAKAKKREKAITLLIVALGIIGAVAFYIVYPVEEGYNLGRGYVKAREESLGSKLLRVVKEKTKKAADKLKELYTEEEGGEEEGFSYK